MGPEDPDPVAPSDLWLSASVGRDPIPVLNMLVGAVLGFLSGLGVGGGSLLLLWLTLVAGVDQSTARVMNLMFFIPCALVATAFRWKRSKADWRLALPAVAGGLLGALLGNSLGPTLDKALLKKAFGILFLLTGIRELRWKP